MNINIINNYYSTVDKKILDNICQNNNLKNLIYLSIENELNIFNKKNNKWQLKSKDKLIKECENIKKKELKITSSNLNNLAKLTNNKFQNNDIKYIIDNLESKITNIDKFIIHVNNIDNINNINNYKNTDKYLEYYSNC